MQGPAVHLLQRQMSLSLVQSKYQGETRAAEVCSLLSPHTSGGFVPRFPECGYRISFNTSRVIGAIIGKRNY